MMMISVGVGSTIDKDTIERLKREIQELKNNFDRERKEIEQSCKLEIADIEAKHDEDKGEIMKNIEREKVFYHMLSYDIASRSEIMPCNKIYKPLVVYRFSGNVMASITTLHAK